MRFRITSNWVRFCNESWNCRDFYNFSFTGRTSTTSLNKPIFHMGASFEDKSDDEGSHETNGLGMFTNNNNKNVKDENIPLVARKS